MIISLITLFLVAFFLNLLYELLHRLLYTTCIEASLKKYIYLILKAAIFDGVIITILYAISYWIFPTYHIVIFVLLSLLFAYVWEIYSLKKGKWEYSKNMPKICSIGLTPLLQLAITGVVAIYICSYFFV